MTSNKKKRLDKILKLVEGGQENNAYELLKDFLIENPDDIEGWKYMLKLAPNYREQEFADNRVMLLSGQNPDQSVEPAHSQKNDYSDLPRTPPGWEEREVQLALELNTEGRSNQARKIVDEVLGKAPGFPPAVYASGLLSESMLEYRNALADLAELSKSDPDAEDYYQKLASWKTEEKRKISWRLGWRPLWILVSGAAVFLILIGMAIGLPMIFPDTDDGGTEDGFGPEPLINITCEELIANALAVSDKSCEKIGTNEVCYGNYQLITEYEGPADAFDVEGDVLEVEALHSLIATPLDLIEELWGVAVFKLKATIEGTIPGQNVTFLVFGDTEVDNESGDMTAFYFSTGFSGITCKGINFDGIQIEMPDGYKFVFKANGVEISLEGDAIMSAQAGDMMNFTLANGSAEVTSDGVTRILEAGSSVSVPMDENLSATGSPSEVVTVSGEMASLICQLYGVYCPPGETSVILGIVTPTGDETDPVPGLPSETESGSVAGITLVPTDTPVPQNTPVPVCGQIVVRFNSYGNFQITNNSSSPVVLTSMNLNWPEINGRWTKVYLGRLIGSPNADTPPASHSFSGHGAIRTFYPGDSKTLTVDFVNGVKGGPYSATFRFDNGCSRLARN